jgi:hypothetical protein
MDQLSLFREYCLNVAARRRTLRVGRTERWLPLVEGIRVGHWEIPVTHLCQLMLLDQ